MKKTNSSNRLAVLEHSPGIQRRCLYRMGLMDATGAPEALGIEVLASISSGCLYSDMADQTDNAKRSARLYAELLSVAGGEKMQDALCLLGMEYIALGESLPKPISLLAQDGACLQCFLTAFLENWAIYLREDHLQGEGAI